MSLTRLFRKPAQADITGKLDGQALDQLFREARTHNGWRPIDVPDALLEEAVDLAKMGPTSANVSPLRIVFVRSPQAKLRLEATLMPGNVEKTMAAPVTAILGHDTKFYELVCSLMPMPRRGSSAMRRLPMTPPIRTGRSRSPTSFWPCGRSAWMRVR